MSILPIYLYNDPVLRVTCKPVEKNTPALQKLIDDMLETMYEAHGIGLAAPQIGSDLRVFVADMDVMAEDEPEEKTYGPMVFVNPQIVSCSDERTEVEEGCLSLPGLRETVKRPESITVKYQDRNLKEQSQSFDGWMARVFQHELDHLDGILFFDRVGSFRKRLLNRKLELIDNGLAESDYEVVPRQG